VRSKIVSLVKKRTPSRPSIGGIAGREPVAMTALLKRSTAPPTETVRRSLNEASPKKTSTPSDLRRAAESCGAMSARRVRMRVITA
jgi:hypothetical protein